MVQRVAEPKSGEIPKGCEEPEARDGVVVSFRGSPCNFSWLSLLARHHLWKPVYCGVGRAEKIPSHERQKGLGKC